MFEKCYPDDVHRVAEAGGDAAFFCQATAGGECGKREREFHVADFAQASRDIRILAIEADVGVIAADFFERVTANDEIAALKDRADVEYETDDNIEYEADVIEDARDEPYRAGNVVIDEWAGDADELRVARELGENAIDPSWRYARVGVDIRDQLAGRGEVAGAAGMDDALFRFIDEFDARIFFNIFFNCRCRAVGRRIVDDDDLDVVARSFVRRFASRQAPMPASSLYAGMTKLSFISF